MGKFIHNDKICDFEWKRDVWNVTVADCADYEGRFVWSGNYDYYKCAITINNVKPEDTGAWSCEMESYAAGKYRGYGYNVTAKFDIAVEVKTTTTTTTTTTLTTTKTTTSETSEAVVEEKEEEVDNAVADEQNADAPESDVSNEEKDMSALYVIIAIIIILVVIGVIMYGLHYKGKLPQTFYN